MSSDCLFSYLDDIDFDLRKHKSSKMQLTSCNVIAGLAVLAIMYTLIYSPQDNYYCRQKMHQVSSAFSNISAMLVKNTESRKNCELKPASVIVHIAPRVSSLGGENLAVVADAKDADKSSSAYKNMTEEEQMELSTLVTDFLKTSEVVVVMFFAEWCGHCSNAMHPFNEASQMQPEVPFLMINADSVPRSFLSKKTGGIVDLPHFPFVCRFENGVHVKTFENEMSAKNLVDDVADLPNSKKATADALQMLF